VDGFNSSDVQQGANGDCWYVHLALDPSTHRSLHSPGSLRR
jgi:hypothetical protein